MKPLTQEQSRPGSNGGLETWSSFHSRVAMMTPGLFRELSPQPLAPEARIMPLDQTASCKHDLQQDTDSRIRYYLTG